MKKILLILLIILGYANIYGQSNYIENLPEYPAIVNDPTDVMYMYDGATDRHIKMPTFLQVISDSLYVMRNEYMDSLTVIRALAGGGGALSKTGNFVSLTNLGDTLSIGDIPAVKKFNVDGDARFVGNIEANMDGTAGGNIYANMLWLNTGNGSGSVFSVNDDLWFADNTAGIISLNTLKTNASSFFGLTGTTRYTVTSSENWHLGGTAATTYKLKITGNLNATGYADIGTRILFSGKNAELRNGNFIGAIGATEYNTIGVGLNGIANEIIFNPATREIMTDEATSRIGIQSNYIDLDAGNQTLRWTGDYLIDLSATPDDTISGGSGSVLSAHLTDTLWYDYLDGAASGSRFLVLTSTGGADSGVLNPVFRGLQDPLWDINKWLADQQNGEIRWVHIDDITGDTISTYGLPDGMDAFEALQYTQEMSLRLLVEQDSLITKQDSLIIDYGKRLDSLEKKQFRMTRQDYKYKAKLMKLENRLK